MKTPKFLLVSILCIMLLIHNTKISSCQISAEIHVGIGYTGVDIQEWTYGASDWGQMMGQIYVQAFPIRFGGIVVGAEFGFQHYLWYVDDTYGYEHNVDAFNLMGIVRSQFNENFFAELGFGAYFFGEFTDPGFSAILGYIININEKLAIPLKFRTGVVFDKDTNLYPVGISAGLAYTF